MEKKEEKGAPKEISEDELIEEVTKIELESFDIITELVEEELEEKRKELSYPKDRKFKKSWSVKNPEPINGSKTNGCHFGYASNSMLKINKGDHDA